MSFFSQTVYRRWIWIVLGVAATVFQSPLAAAMDTRSFAGTLLSLWSQRASHPGQSVVSTKEPHGSILMSVNPDDLETIERFGFLNLFEVGQSNATPNFNRRIMFENLWSGLTDMGMEPASLRPKYAYLDPLEDGKAVFMDQYGSVFFKFRDSIRARSTYSEGDSLEGTAMERLPQHFSRSSDRHYNGRKFGSMNYMEAHIWGALNLSDAEAIYIRSDFFREKKLEIERYADRNGLNLFTYDPHVDPKFKNSGQFAMKNIKEINFSRSGSTAPQVEKSVAGLVQLIESPSQSSRLRSAGIVALSAMDTPEAKRALSRIRISDDKKVAAVLKNSKQRDVNLRRSLKHLFMSPKTRPQLVFVVFQELDRKGWLDREIVESLRDRILRIKEFSALFQSQFQNVDAYLSRYASQKKTIYDRLIPEKDLEDLIFRSKYDLPMNQNQLSFLRRLFVKDSIEIWDIPRPLEFDPYPVVARALLKGDPSSLSDIKLAKTVFADRSDSTGRTVRKEYLDHLSKSKSGMSSEVTQTVASMLNRTYDPTAKRDILKALFFSKRFEDPSVLNAVGSALRKELMKEASYRPTLDAFHSNWQELEPKPEEWDRFLVDLSSEFPKEGMLRGLSSCRVRYSSLAQ